MKLATIVVLCFALSVRGCDPKQCCCPSEAALRGAQPIVQIHIPVEGKCQNKTHVDITCTMISPSLCASGYGLIFRISGNQIIWKHDCMPAELLRDSPTMQSSPPNTTSSLEHEQLPVQS